VCSRRELGGVSAIGAEADDVLDSKQLKRSVVIRSGAIVEVWIARC
jgi:hypothetical protein